MHLFRTWVRFGCSRSPKVDDFGTNRKCVCDFVFVPHCDYLAPFLRYDDLLAKNCLFLLPLSDSAPSLAVFPLEFYAKVNHEETRVMGLSYSEDPMIIARVVLTWHWTVTDRQDGWTESIIANTALCIASYAVALQKTASDSHNRKKATCYTHCDNSAIKNWFVEMFTNTRSITTMLKCSKCTATKWLQL